MILTVSQVERKQICRLEIVELRPEVEFRREEKERGEKEKKNNGTKCGPREGGKRREPWEKMGRQEKN